MTDQATPDRNRALDALFEPVNRSDAPGLVVGVAHHGKTVYRRAFGLASIRCTSANSVGGSRSRASRANVSSRSSGSETCPCPA